LEARLAPFLAGAPGAGVAVVSVGAAGADVQTLGRTGYRDAHPPRADSLFELGSGGEVLAGLLLAERVAGGRVRLDSPLLPLLPESLRFSGGEAITLEQLSLHTAGLPPIRGDAAREAASSEEQLGAMLGKMRLRSVPGERVERSALGTALLGHALALRDGHPYGALLSERVLQPLTMVSAGTFERTGALEDRLVEGLDADNRPTPGRFEAPLFGAPFAVRASANDVARYLQALLAPSTTPLAAALIASLAPRRLLDDESELSLGWRIERGRASYYQEGASTAFRNALVIEPGQRRAFALLVASARVDALSALRELIRELDLPPGPTAPRDRALVATPPPHVARAQADFGGLFRLVGHAVESQVVRAGGDVRVVLYWQCLARTPRDYRVSVHGEDSTRKWSLRADHYPAQGRFPTFDWHAGDVVADEFVLHVPRAWGGSNVTLWLGFEGGGQTLKAAPGPIVDLSGRARGPSLEVVR